MLSSYLSKNIFLLRILPVFTLGISAGFFSPKMELLPYFISLIIITIAFLLSKKGIFASLFFLLLGFILIQSRLALHSDGLNNVREVIIGTITTPIKEGKNTKHFIIETDRGLRINVYTKNKDLIIKRDDQIEFTSSLKQIRNNADSQFDYEKYMKTKYCSHYCFADGIQVIKNSNINNPILYLSHSIHNYLNKSIDQSKLSHKTSGIIAAMLIGERSQLDKETKEHFIKAGTIHILAISGLHTGIIFLLIRLILCKLCRIRENSLYFLFASIFCLWSYALITYLPSSVLRASLIISFILIAKASNRESCIFNTIGASAFLILLFNPAALLTPGFQMSFAAYTSIVYFFPKLKKLCTFKNRLLTKVWEISILSLSAQIGTIPISCLYFGQIASYSIISNILITVFIPIIIYTALLWFVIRIEIITKLLDLLVSIINMIIDFISKLPGAVISIDLNLFEVIAMYIIGFSSFYMIWYKRKNIIWISLSSILLLSICLTIDKLLLITI